MARTIKVEEVRKLPRGRKANLDPKLQKALAALKPGSALILDEFSPVAEDQRSRVSQQIRNHWRSVREDKPSIAFSPEGDVQVFAKK